MDIDFLQLLSTVGGVLQLAGPIAGYVWAVRQRRTRRQIVMAAAIGGVPAGLVMVLATYSVGAGVMAGLPSVAICAATGALLALAGLAARGIGNWMYRQS